MITAFRYTAKNDYRNAYDAITDTVDAALSLVERMRRPPQPRATESISDAASRSPQLHAASICSPRRRRVTA